MVKLEQLLGELLIWLDKNIHKPLKIEDVAQRSGYSKWHLQRVFFQVMDINLAHYIRDKKLEKAALDLLQSDETVLSISYKYGFDSQQSFTRSFSKKYRLPPSRFRRLNGNTHSPHRPT